MAETVSSAPSFGSATRSLDLLDAEARSIHASRNGPADIGIASQWLVASLNKLRTSRVSAWRGCVGDTVPEPATRRRWHRPSHAFFRSFRKPSTHENGKRASLKEHL